MVISDGYVWICQFTCLPHFQPVVWQFQEPARKTWLATAPSLAAPRAGLARFEGFGRFGGFEAFKGSIRQFRASRKRNTWLATAPSFAAEKELPGLPEPVVWQFQEPERKTWLATAPSLAAPRAGLARFEGFGGFEACKGSIWQFRASRKRKTWLATAPNLAVWRV